MRTSRRAATAAVSVSLALTGITAEAHADSTTVLYVNGSSTSCIDSGTGTAAAPYCTIQAAANAAVAGDTVEISGGTYTGQVDIKSVGTAAEPIVFRLDKGIATIQDGSGQTGPALSFDGASFIDVEGYLNTPPPWTNRAFSISGVAVNGSSHVTLNGITAMTSSTSQVALKIAGTSSDIALTRSTAGNVVVDSGSSGDVISTNFLPGAITAIQGISITGASNTDITSNTIQDFSAARDAISVSGGSTGTSIENNVVAYPGSSTAPSATTIAVDTSSAPGTTLDYNVVYPHGLGFLAGTQSPYSWAGTVYATAAALNSATGESAHDLNTNPDLNGAGTRLASAPQLNSANSSAPGMLATDIYGAACTADPIVAVTGAGSPAYCERGAAQQTYSTTVSANASTQGALTAVLTGNVAQSTATDGIAGGVYTGPTPAVSYTIAWGDGQTQTVQASSTAATTDTTHKYAKIGTYTITDTANLTDGTTVSTKTSVTTAGSGFTPLGPVRILDTRSSTAGFRGSMPSGNCYGMPVAKVDGIPANATAVALNLTVTNTVGNGVFYLGSRTSSNLNYGSGQTVANSAIVPLNPDGSVDVCSAGASNASADVIVDVTGYFAQTSGAGYQASSPERILDTRYGTGAPKAKIAAKSGLSVPIVGADSIPAGVTAVAVHVTETNATGGGWIAAEPDGAGVPGTSSLNFAPGQTISNTVIVPVAADGKIELYNGAISGSVDLIADVSGYFAASAPDAFVPVTPYRAVDTRGTAYTLAPYGMQGFQLNTEQFTLSVPGIPLGATFAANLTATDETASGHLTVYPFNTAVEPNVSALNFGKGQTVAGFGLFGSPTGGDGVNVDNESNGKADVIFDVFGYFASN